MRAPLIVLNLAHALPVILLTLVPGSDAQGNPYTLSFFDAMYIVGYTATTIGFGEIPYAFTYPQRMVMLLTIYLSVPAWIYAIGSIIALLQDNAFANAIKMNRFRRRVRNLNEDFIILCGYSDAGRLMIDRLNRDHHYRIVVIDKNVEKIEQLESELYMPSIPAIAADASLTDVLRAAGIQSERCKFLITLFDESQLNLKIAVRGRILNKKVQIIARSGIGQNGNDLSHIGVDRVVDVFSVIARRIDFALRSPYLFNILSWVQGGNLHVSKTDNLPRGKYIVCGGGRMSRSLAGALERHGLTYALIDIVTALESDNASEYDIFLDAGITEADCIIAGTRDDAINLSIVATARAMNPGIFTIVRENELQERSLFSNLRVDKIFALDQIAAFECYNAIHRPLSFRFMDAVEQQGIAFAETLLRTITQCLNKRPALIELQITEERMYALARHLRMQSVTIGELFNERFDHGGKSGIMVLGIERQDGTFVLMPDATVRLMEFDRVLFAATRPGLERFETVVNHHYELMFLLRGIEESRIPLLWK